MLEQAVTERRRGGTLRRVIETFTSDPDNLLATTLRGSAVPCRRQILSDFLDCTSCRETFPKFAKMLHT
jgi:hypothetical protein